jgi:hypothetical protein
VEDTVRVSVFALQKFTENFIDIVWPRFKPVEGSTDFGDQSPAMTRRAPRAARKPEQPKTQVLGRPRKYPAGEELYWIRMKERQRRAQRAKLAGTRETIDLTSLASSTKRTASEAGLDDDDDENSKTGPSGFRAHEDLPSPSIPGSTGPTPTNEQPAIPGRRVRKKTKKFEDIQDTEGILPVPESVDDKWKAQAAQFMGRSNPGVYISPQGRRKPDGKKKGRPQKSRIAVFKSSRLSGFPWFSSNNVRRNPAVSRFARPKPTVLNREAYQESVYPKVRFITSSLAHSYSLSMYAFKLATTSVFSPPSMDLTTSSYSKRRGRPKANFTTFSPPVALDDSLMPNAIGDVETVLAPPSPSNENELANSAKEAVAAAGVEIRNIAGSDLSKPIAVDEPNAFRLPSEGLTMIDSNAHTSSNPILDSHAQAQYSPPLIVTVMSDEYIVMSQDRSANDHGGPGKAGEQSVNDIPSGGQRTMISNEDYSILDDANNKIVHNLSERTENLPETDQDQHMEDSPATTDQDENALPALAVDDSVSEAKTPKPRGKRGGGIDPWGGSMAMLRRKIVMDIIEKSEGVFPGDNELWYPFMTKWAKVGRDERADRRTIRNIVKYLVDNAKLRQLKFSFKDHKGVMVTRTIITKIDIPPTDAKVKEVQKKMIEEDPQPYFPPGVEVDPSLRRRSEVFTAEELRKYPNRRRTKVPLDLGEQVQLDRLPVKYQIVEERQTRKEEKQRFRTLKESGAAQKLRPLVPKPTKDRTFDSAKKQAIGPLKRNVARLQKLNVRLVRPGPFDPRLASGTSQLDFLETEKGRLAPIAGATGLQSSLTLTSPAMTQQSSGLNQPQSGLGQSQGDANQLMPSPNQSEYSLRPVNPSPISLLPFETTFFQRFDAQERLFPSQLQTPTAVVLPEEPVAHTRRNSAETIGSLSTTTSTSHSESRSQELFRVPYVKSSGSELRRGVLKPGKSLPTSLGDILSNLRGNYDEKAISHDPIKFANMVERVMRWELNHPEVFECTPQTHFINHEVNGQIFTPAAIPRIIMNPISKHGEGSSDPRPKRRRTANTENGEPDWAPMPNDQRADRFEEYTFGEEILPPAAEPPTPVPGRSSELPMPVVPRQRRNRKRKAVSDAPAPLLPKKPARLPRVKIPKLCTSTGRSRANILESVPETVLYRILMAMVVTRTLVGGVDGAINWDVIDGVFPDINLKFLKKLWPRINQRYKTQFPEMKAHFQEAFLGAYERSEVPGIDYNDIKSYPWSDVVDWAMKVGVFSKESRLPHSRGQVEETYNILKEDRPFSSEMYADVAFITHPERQFVHTAVIYASPEDRDKSGGNLTRLPNFQNSDEELLLLAKSWIRQNAATPDEMYSSQVAKELLMNIPDSNLQDATKRLDAEKTLVARSKHKNAPGRIWDVSELFLAAIDKRRIVTAKGVRQAAWYKTHILDKDFAEKGYSNVNILSDDGDVMAILHLLNDGFITLGSNDVPGNELGLGTYLTRQMDKNLLHFNLTIHPGPSFHALTSGNDNINIPPPKPPSTQVLPNSPDFTPTFLPLWYDIHGNFFRLMWDMLICAICGLIVLRPGLTIEEIKDQLKPVMEMWELKLCMGWLVNVGLVIDETRRGGYRVAKVWWLRLGMYLGEDIEVFGEDADGEMILSGAIDWLTRSEGVDREGG